MPQPVSYEQSGESGATFTVKLSITTLPTQVPFFRCRSVYFESAIANTDYVYVSNGPFASSENGAQIAPGGGIGMGSDKSDRFWLVANSGTQTIYAIVSASGESIQHSSGNAPGSSSTLATLFSFQQAVTGTSAALAANSCSIATIKNDDASTEAIYIGGSAVSASTGFKLAAGEGFTVSVSNTNVIYVVAAGTGGTADVIYG